MESDSEVLGCSENGEAEYPQAGGMHLEEEREFARELLVARDGAEMEKQSSGRVPAWRAAMVALALMCICGAANAVLGGKVATVAADQAQMKASLKVSSNGRFQVHELQADGGNVVREFVSPAGDVFGVAWSGRAMPQYSQLLGSYTDEITKAARTRRDHRAPLKIEEPGFVFSAFGAMRFYAGRAYIPSKVPAGVLPEEIK